MNAATFSRKPKTLIVSPARAVASWPFFRRDLARIMPARAKGIAKDVRNRFPIPIQNEIEQITLISPNARLKIPLFPEMLLILFPPAWKSYTIHLANPELRGERIRFTVYSSIFTPILFPSSLHSYRFSSSESFRHFPVLTSNLLPWQRHVRTNSSSLPLSIGHRAWGQRFKKAWSCPSALRRSTFLPPGSTCRSFPSFRLFSSAA